jgi:hypothetical protein
MKIFKNLNQLAKELKKELPYNFKVRSENKKKYIEVEHKGIIIKLCESEFSKHSTTMQLVHFDENNVLSIEKNPNFLEEFQNFEFEYMSEYTCIPHNMRVIRSIHSLYELKYELTETMEAEVVARIFNAKHNELTEKIENVKQTISEDLTKSYISINDCSASFRCKTHLEPLTSFFEFNFNGLIDEVRIDDFAKDLVKLSKKYKLKRDTFIKVLKEKQ